MSVLGLVGMRLWRRAGAATLIFFCFLIPLVFFLDTPFTSSSQPFNTSAASPFAAPPKIPLCNQDQRASAAQEWEASMSRYDHLIEDKFTISLSTFHRPKELDHVLTSLLAAEIPSLLEILVIWNNFDEPTPQNMTSDKGVAVRYRKPDRDSLNEKLRPVDIRTKAVLLSDDDIYYRPSDLEFAFQTWRRFGQNRITGALARCVFGDDDGLLHYDACPDARDTYSLVLTNLAFIHVSFLDFYMRDDVPWLVKVRDIIDENMNCEDIAFNYVVSLITSEGPLLVRGRDQYVNLDPPGGISRQTGHMEARSKCLNDFADALQCLPLVEESVRVERGNRYNVWYKSVWDRITLF